MIKQKREENGQETLCIIQYQGVGKVLILIKTLKKFDKTQQAAGTYINGLALLIKFGIQVKLAP